MPSKSSFYGQRPDESDKEGSDSGEKYKGPDRREEMRRKQQDRRGDVRFEIDKDPRRKGEGRREEDKTPKYW